MLGGLGAYGEREVVRLEGGFVKFERRAGGEEGDDAG